MKKIIAIFILCTTMVFIGCNPATPEANQTEAITTVPPTATLTPAPTETTLLTEVGKEEPATPQPDVADMLAPPGKPRETYYAAYPVTITLDGDLSDWAGIPLVTIPENGAAIAGDEEMTFSAAADDTYLYFMANVIDDNIISGKHGSEYWNEDSAEFYVNATGDFGLKSYADGVAQITVPALNINLPVEEAIVSGMQGSSAEALIKATETETGYAIEMAVPLKNQVWNIEPAHGNVIGFQAHLNGAAQRDRSSKAIWSAADTADSSYLHPSVFGRLIFHHTGQEAVEPVEPTATPTIVPVSADVPYKNVDLPVEERVEDLLGRMSLLEKIGQMTLVEKNSIGAQDVATFGIGGVLSGGSGYPFPNTPENWAEMVDNFQQAALSTQLAIPIIYGVDAVHGHNNVYGATIFPHNIGLGAANDPDLVEQIGHATAQETAATGIYWNYAPVLAVPQDIRWGRTYEGYSENTEIVSLLGTAMLRGMQGDNLSAPDTILGTPKHFVGDGGTAWGSSTTDDYSIDQGVTDVDEETLRAIHLPPYIDVIEAGAQSIMVSFSSWGGLKMHAQKYLLSDVLRDELGFDGFVVSDWAGIDAIDADYYRAVVTAINAGVDMNMVPYNYTRFIGVMEEAVNNGDIPPEHIDEAVRRILTVKFNLGLFEQPFSNADLLPTIGSSEHRTLAREAVQKSLVLLKNENNVLPLSKDTPLIYVAGTSADDIGIQSGGWTIEWQGKPGNITPGTTILQGIEATVSPDTTVTYKESGQFDDDAVADVCIATVGEYPYAEGIGDNGELTLNATDIQMLSRLPEYCSSIAVVVVSGRPLIITDMVEEWDALVAVWLPGTEGQGVADVLFGDQPFTGKLPFTWPRLAEQLPFDFETLNESEPLYPFGYGLEN